MPLQLWLGMATLILASCLILDAARRVARAAFPGWLLEQLAASSVVAVSLVIIILEVLGTIGWLSPAPMFSAALVTWGTSLALTRGRPRGRPVAELILDALRAAAAETGGWETWLTRAAVLLGGAAMVVLTGYIVHAVYGPRPEFDVLAGHLPVPVQWLQAGNTRILPYVTPVSVQGQYPANAELLALWLMLPVHRDFLVQLASLPGTFMAVAGLVLGIRRLGGSRPVALTLGLCVPLMPEVLSQLIGTNMQDMLMLGGALCLLGFTASHALAPGAQKVVAAGLCAGIAVGTRYGALEAIPTISLLLLAIEWSLPREQRRLAPRAALFGGAALLTGIYFYVRNQLLTGDFVYPQSLPWHHVQATELVAFPGLRSYLQLGFAPEDWAAAAGQTLRLFGPVWFGLVCAAVLVPLIALRRPRRHPVDWGWKLVPALVFVAFVVQLGSAGGVSHGQLARGLQALQIRYLLLTVGVSALILGGQLRIPQALEGRLTVLLLLVTLLSAVLQPADRLRVPMVAAALLLLGLGLFVTMSARRYGAVVTAGAGAAAGVLVLIMSPLLADHYDRQRAVVGMAHDDARIAMAPDPGLAAVAGFCQIYGLYGPALDRRVEYLTGADNRVDRPTATTYERWLASLRAYHATWLVVGSDVCFLDVAVPQRQWAQEHPETFREVQHNGVNLLYNIRPGG